MSQYPVVEVGLSQRVNHFFLYLGLVIDHVVVAESCKGCLFYQVDICAVANAEGVHSACVTSLLLNQSNDLWSVVHCTVGQKKNMSLLLFLWLRQVKDFFEGLEDLCATKVSFKVGYAVERFLESFVVVFNATLSCEEKLEV